MNKSLACVLNGHAWDYSFTGGFYKCEHCKCWAHNLRYDYQGKDVTEVYVAEYPDSI